MRAVVTGGGGFIGSHLTDSLLAGGAEVLVIDDFSTGRRENLHAAKLQHGERLTVLEVDMCLAEAARELRKYRPEIVFHQAAQMNVRRSVDDPVFDATRNVVGLVSMIEAAKEAGARRFFMASTGGAIYGEQEQFPADENHRTEPECPYGVSKHAGELYLEYYARAHKMQCVALRYANVYGPRQNPKGEAGVVAIFAERILAGQELTVNGDGLQTRDFIFVGDVVAANLAVCNAEFSPGFEVFNVGRGQESTVLDIVSGLAEAAAKEQPGVDVRVTHGPALHGEQRRSVIDAGKLSKRLGWSPQMSLGKGLELTLESFRNAQ